MVRLGIAQGCIADAGELVGERANSFVAMGSRLHGERPGAQWIERSMAALRDGGSLQHGACAMRQQHAQVPIAALADAPEMTRVAGRLFFGCEAEPGGEVSGVLEMRDIAVAVSSPTPGTDNNVTQAGDCWANWPSSRSSSAMRSSSSRISSSTARRVVRSSAGIAVAGSASSLATCSTPTRAPTAIVMPNSRQKPRSAPLRAAPPHRRHRSCCA